MSSLQLLLQHPWTLALGWTLIHFLWQGSLIALLFAFANLCVTKPSNRYITACTAMLLMLLASFTTFFWLVGTAAEASVAAPALPAFAVAAVAAKLTTGQSNMQADSALTRYLPWLVCAWFAGVLMLSVRSVRAWVSAQRLRTNSTHPADPLWLEMLDRLSRRFGMRQPVKLLQSAVARVPGVVGWFRPVILLPVSAVAGLSPGMLEAVIAHELAHVRRGDYLVNIFQTAVETLLFYHPAVWWIGKKIREERENCCDDLAVDACGNALTYARALTELEQLRGSQLVMAATSGSLVGRIRRLLGVRQPAGQTHAVPIAGIVALSAIFAIWALAQGSGPNRSYETAYLIQAAQATPSEPPQASPATSPSPSAQSNGFIGGLAANGYKDLTVDQLIAFKIHGVTPDFVRQIQAAGLGHPDPDELVSMKIHDVSPEFVNEMKAAGFSGLTVDELVSFKIHGVTPARAKELQQLWGKVTADDLVSAEIHGLTPEYAREIKSLGLGDPSFDDLISMKIHDVTPEFANAMKTLGIKGLNIDELTSFKIHGVDPAAVREFQKLGFSPLSADDLVSMQIHGVTPDFMRAMKEAGISDLSVDDAVSARIHGVTPEFVRAVRKHGFNNLALEQIIELKRLDIVSGNE